jgi:hypothetical protein
MGQVEPGEMQFSVTTIAARAQKPAEYTISVLRIFARKDEGEPLLPAEREAARMALRLLGKDW